MTDIQRYILRALLKGERLISEHINGVLLWDLTGTVQNHADVQPLVDAGYLEGKRDKPPLTYQTVWTLTDEGRSTAELIARMDAAKGNGPNQVTPDSQK